MKEPNEPVQHPITRDTPLPGFYPCLTLQLNITRYAANGVGRMVLVVRDPNSGHELLRAHCATSEWQTVVDGTYQRLAEALSSVAWMQDGVND